MSTELFYLVLVATLTALTWLPYVLNTLSVRGLNNAVGYPENPAPLAPWAQRMKAAHYNSVESLVVFATLVIVAHLAGVSDGATATAAMVYFWARVAHLIVYTFGVPWLRTLSFAVGYAAMLVFAWKLLAG
ncbi:MAG: MAPEG family protein [Gammaproteobacteria bacterium]|nr:MAPEG family protein [Gammaproteobacteria bacterium]